MDARCKQPVKIRIEVASRRMIPALRGSGDVMTVDAMPSARAMDEKRGSEYAPAGHDFGTLCR